MIPFFNAMGWKIIQKKAAREEKTMDHPKYGKLVKKIVLIIKTDKFNVVKITDEDIIRLNFIEQYIVGAHGQQ